MMYHKISRRFVLSLGCALALAACATDEPVSGQLPSVGFDHLTPVYFNVTDIKITQDYKSPLQPPNAEHRFSTSPASAMTAWANARLKAAGNSDATLEFIIEDASVVEIPLKKTEGFKGMLTYEPTERYDATMTGVIDIDVPVGSGTGGVVKATVTRSVEISENATLAEREQAWFSMVETMMDDFNREMDTQIHTYLSRWVVR